MTGGSEEGGRPDTRPLMRRLSTTPMRDLVRLRATGALDWIWYLQREAFDPALERHLARVVRKAKLNHAMRVRAARMLAEDARARIGGAESSLDVIEVYSPVGAAARDVAKRCTRDRRVRTWARRRLRKWVIGAIAGALVTYAVLTVRYYAISAPVLANNYAAQANDRMFAHPESERGWPVYRDAYLEILSRTGSDTWPPVDFSEDSEDPERRDRALVECADALARVREAAGRPVLGAPYGSWPGETPRWNPRALLVEPDPDAVARDNPLLVTCIRGPGVTSTLRILSRALAADAMLAVRQGDAERAAANCAALLDLGTQLLRDEDVLPQLVGAAAVSLGARVVAEIIAEHPGLLTDTGLVEVRRALVDVPTDPISIQLAAQVFPDIAQRIYSDNGSGDGVVGYRGHRALVGLGTGVFSTRHRLFGPLITLGLGSRAETTGLVESVHRSYAAMANQPRHLRDMRPYRLACDEVDANSRLASTTIGAWGLLPGSVDRMVAHRGGALVGVALERHRREHDAWPASLDALVPDYLASVPADLVDGMPIRYVVSDGRPIVYSLGSDGDDDAGSPAFEASTWMFSQNLGYDGDWWLFPWHPDDLPNPRLQGVDEGDAADG